MHPLVVLLRALYVEVMHYEFNVKALHIGTLHFGILCQSLTLWS